jgi:hypothetical protein
MSTKHCDLCLAVISPDDLGEYDEKTGIYACWSCVDNELRIARDERREPALLTRGDV